MTPLTWAEVEANTALIEDALDRTPEIDRWCSGPDWILAVRQGFAPHSSGLLFRGGDGPVPGFALLARYELEDGSTMVAGLEPLWGFAAPVFGPDLEGLGAELCRELSAHDWRLLVLPGVPPPDGPRSYAVRLARSLSPLGVARIGEGIVRQVADIGDGSEAWLARRSQRFRRNLRRAERQAAEGGLGVVDARHDPEIFERIMAIERRSWKGRDDGGITAPEMAATYRSMIERLRARDRLRVGIAVKEGHDVGYILGGVRNDRYRGLQLSYRSTMAQWSIGHLLQWWQLRSLEPEGLRHYDLGMDMDYKRRWADRPEPTLTLIIERQ
ncbi:MAG: GNAT family N-acetyltransferase [Actinomycetota bacterium]